jgi:hypothetical protein
MTTLVMTSFVHFPEVLPSRATVLVMTTSVMTPLVHFPKVRFGGESPRESIIGTAQIEGLIPNYPSALLRLKALYPTIPFGR